MGILHQQNLYKRNVWPLRVAYSPQELARVREAYTYFGGVKKTLKTADNVEVRTTHFYVDTFMKKLSEKQGTLVQICFSSSDKQFPAIRFPGHVNDLINQLQAFGVVDPQHKNFIWEYFHSGDHTYLVRKSDYDVMVNHFSPETHQMDPAKTTIVERPQDIPKVQTTVILSGGILNNGQFAKDSTGSGRVLGPWSECLHLRR